METIFKTLNTKFHYFPLSCLLAEVNALVELLGNYRKKKSGSAAIFHIFLYHSNWRSNSSNTADIYSFNCLPQLRDLFFIYLQVIGSLTFGAVSMLIATLLAYLFLSKHSSFSVIPSYQALRSVSDFLYVMLVFFLILCASPIICYWIDSLEYLVDSNCLRLVDRL